MKLFTYASDFRAFKTLIAAQYAGVDIDVPSPFTMGVDDKSAEFLAKSPTGKVPLLETAEGSIFQSNAIARYVARLRTDSGLFGSTFFEASQVDSWVDWSWNELEVAAVFVFYPILGAMKTNPGTMKTSVEDLKKALKVLDAHLLNSTYMVGESITLADIVIASILVYPMQFVMDNAWRKATPSLTRWFNTVINQPQFKAVLGDIELAKKDLSADFLKGSSKKDKKKAEPKKKAEKKAEAPKPAAPKKVQHPLSLLPKPKMVMDNWKRTYSNYRDEPFSGVMVDFWKMYDSEGYSLFKATYKYMDELEVDFMTSNLVNGLLQRSDEMRKYGFGVMQMRRNDGDKFITVDGCWLLRGGSDSWKYMVECNPDAEHYEWTSVDPTTEEGKKFVLERFCCDYDDVVDGTKVLEAKVFK